MNLESKVQLFNNFVIDFLHLYTLSCLAMLRLDQPFLHPYNAQGDEQDQEGNQNCCKQYYNRDDVLEW